MLVALSSSSFPSDLVAQQLQPMLLGVEAQLELFPAACRLCHMFPNQLVETMVIQITADMIAAALTKPPATDIASHTLPKVKPRSPNHPNLCTTVDHLPLEAMEELDHNSPSNHSTVVSLNLNLVALVVQLRQLFLVSH